MLMLGPLGFAAPWVLTALVALPALWLILRALPPAPRLQAFPAVRLLAGLRDPDPQARRTPWWLLALRIAALVAAILAFAGPVWRPQPPAAAGTGPLLVLIDAGWAAAPGWDARKARAEAALRAAAAAGRPSALLALDGQGLPEGAAIPFAPATEALAALGAARPAGWPTTLPADPAAALAQVPDGALSSLWIADGVDHAGRDAWLAALAARGPVTVVPPARVPMTLALAPGPAPALALHGAPPGAAAPGIEAIGPDPQGIARALATLPPGDAAATGERPVALDLPAELRNRILRYQIAGESHAGAVFLADDSVRRRKVALVGGEDRIAEGQVLLSPLHYLRRALTPSADLVEGGLADVLDAAPDVVILVDQLLPDPGRLAAWVDGGGLLIRFAGPRMAGSDALDADPLLPVRLRPGGRDVGGALSWGDPRGLAPLPADGPFAGLVPPAEIAVRAQVMAEPAPDLAAATLAALTDATPLITRAARGSGQVVLVHVTANADWSDWPLSGLFVAMLDRLVATAGRAPAPEGAAAPDAAAVEDGPAFWTPEMVLDGFGREAEPGSLAPVSAAAMTEGPGPGRPAGLYRASERVRALNAGGPLTLAAAWPGATVEAAGAPPPGRSLTGALVAAAALVLALDALASAMLARGGGRVAAAALLALAVLGAAPAAEAAAPSGSVPHEHGPEAAAAMVLAAALGLRRRRIAAAALTLALAAPALAQPLDQRPPIDAEAIRAANEVALAYVVTGDPAIDRVSAEGMAGLSRALTGRSSVEPGKPVAIDLDADALGTLTFLYWPVTTTQTLPGPQAYLRLNQFLRSGGMILFDTRDGDIAGVGGPDRSANLQRLAAPLEIPPLAPIPDDHVLTRSFYLLEGFPGRYEGPPVWAEAPPAGAAAEEGVPFRRLNDGVSPVVIGGNAWAEAWAVGTNGLPTFPVGTGWSGEAQREMAIRFGVNLIVYVLTGNYKSDQVHVPALLERLRAEEFVR